MVQLRDILPERYSLMMTLLLILALVTGTAAAVPSVTGVLPVHGSAAGGDTVTGPGLNTSQPQTSDAIAVSPAPARTPTINPATGPQPTTTALAPVVGYNKGYPIPVPVLFLIGITLVTAGGLLARRRSRQP
jgi:LPXTG-motif cell wall-anchored protein